MEQVSKRIEEIKADLLEYKTLEKKLINSGGVISYQLNTGQTTTQATQMSLNQVRSIIKDLQSELNELENIINCGNFTVLR